MKRRRSGCSMVSATVSSPASRPMAASEEWAPLRRRSFMCSKGSTSATNSAPCRSKAGRPGDEAILDHPLREGLGHHRPAVDDAERRAHLVAVGVGGAGHDAVDHRGGAGDLAGDIGGEVAAALPRRTRRARAARVRPLCGRLSQESSVNGAVPALRRRSIASAMKPSAERGAAGWARSCRMSGWSARSPPLPRSTV